MSFEPSETTMVGFLPKLYSATSIYPSIKTYTSLIIYHILIIGENIPPWLPVKQDELQVYHAHTEWLFQVCISVKFHL